MAKILVLNGPNLNLLGRREPKHYGRHSLDDIHQRLDALLRQAGHELAFFQSNAEHLLIDRIHEAPLRRVAYIVFNPAAFTHTSVALRDALLGVGIPFIEVHLSNVHAREPFRAHSYFSDVAEGVISGFGAEGYEFAVQAAIRRIEQNENA